MSRRHGRKGRLYMGIASDTATAEPIAFLNKWTIDFSTDDVDMTAFGDENKVWESGLPDAGGSYGGWFDDETAQMYTAATDGLSRKFYLYPDNSLNTKYFWGTGKFDMSVEGAVDGGVSISGTFKAASAVRRAGLS